MKYRFLVPLFLVAFLLQSTAAVHIRIFGAGPSLILCCILIDSYFCDSYRGTALGMFFGLLQDLCFAPFIGPSAIAYGLTGFLVKTFKGGVYKESILSIFLAALAGSVLWVLSDWAVFAIFGQIHSILLVLKALPVQIGYHFLILLGYYFLIEKRNDRHSADRRFI